MQKILLISFNLLLTNLVVAQYSITKTEQEQIIDKVSKNLLKHYILPEEGAEMSKIIQYNFENGTYDTIQNFYTFSEKVNSDMRSVFPDLHLGLIYKPWAQMKRDCVAMLSTSNLACESDILQDNIGYLDINSFTFKKSDIDQAFSKISNCEVIIVDLRNNGGGSDVLVKYVMSYFIEGGLHYSSWYNRKGKEVSKQVTFKNINGNRKLEIPLLILIDSNTFSAAEAFAYHIQTLNRATIIGEKSSGGARPKKNININRNFYLSLPGLKSKNNITNEDWEGVGVIPDIEAPTKSALETGVMKAQQLITTHNNTYE